MAGGVTTRTQPASEALVRERARRLVAAGRSRVVLLRATPRWTGADELTVDGAQVLVRPAVSQLAALEAIAEAGPEDYLVLLTDRTDHDLGDAVLVRAERQRVEQMDEWDAIPALFGAREIALDLRRAGSWVPTALLDHMPAGGWPHVPSGTVNKDAALSALLAQVLRLPVRDDVDGVRVLEALDAPQARAAWQATEDPLRSGLVEWAWEGLGPVGALALIAGATPGAVSVIAVALAVDVLWPAGPDAPEIDQIRARTRIEARFGGMAPRPADARALADAARGVIVRMELAEHSALQGLLTQAEALLGDLGWAEGAARSDILPAGFEARLRELAGVVGGPLAGEARSKALEGALRDLLQHVLERRQAEEVRAARMAVRLERRLATPDGAAPAGLGAALLGYVHDGAWVDRAAASIWTGSGDAAVANAYRGLYARVQERRRVADERAARLLAEATARDAVPDGVVPVEDLLQRVVVPLTAAQGVLLVVLDGMSAAVATEIVDGALGAGWVEHVPEDAGRRTGALAVLPTVTAFSRTSLFAGRLVEGTQDTEKRAFRGAFGGPAPHAVVFHKDDLRAPAGRALPEALTAALDDPGMRVVGVVLNTIDDALDKQDPGGTRWTLDRVEHLAELLKAAALTGRVVVLTADHGHVVERGGEARPVAGADARWRPVSSGPVGEGEVLVRGRRVLAPGGAVVLPWREDLRYGAKRAGYHGGASLAEVTIPVVVLERPGAVPPAGWVPAAPQSPAWWNDPVVRREPVAGGRRASRRTEYVAGARIDLAAPPGEALPVVRPAPPGQGVLDLEIPAAAAAGAAAPSLVDALLASAVYRSQHERAGRHALGDATVRAIVDELLARGGRAHRDTLAAAAGIPAAEVGPKFSALSRLLNVDGYAVVSWDADRVTLRLDEVLLREQFGL